MDTLKMDIQAANAARVNALESAEDTRYASADTDAQERQDRNEWEEAENLRGRIIMLDRAMMLTGWAYRTYLEGSPGPGCRMDQEGYLAATGVGRDTYIRKYWNKKQPLNRTYTKERLTAVEDVLDDLERWLQERIDYWETQGRDGERQLQQCEISWQKFRELRQAIITETTPIPD